MSRLLNVDSFEMWANVREFDDGLRLQLTLTDWHKLNFTDDQRVRVGVPGECESGRWFRLAKVREVPPRVVLTLSNRVERVPE